MPTEPPEIEEGDDAGDGSEQRALPSEGLPLEGLVAESLPPGDLGGRALPIMEGRGPWMRMHRVQYDPIFFGRSGEGRFDDPEGEYGVLYAAEDAFGAFVESFGRAPGRNIVSWQSLRDRPLSRIEVAETGANLRLADLTGAGLARIGATADLTSGHYRAAQRWSRALHEHPSEPDGLLYRLKHDPSRKGVAIFERAAGPEAEFFGTLISPEHAKLLSAILEEYEFGLVGGPTAGWGAL